MKHLSTAFLAIVLAIAVYQGGGVTAQDDPKVDQVAEEAKNRALTIVDGPKYVSTIQPAPIEPSQPSSTSTTTQTNVQTPKPQQRPPSKPPLNLDKQPLVTDKLPKPYLVDYPRHYYRHMANLPHQGSYPRPIKLHKNSVYNNFPPVIPLPPHKNHFYVPRPIRVVSASSTSNPSIIKSPKFSLPTQTVNGIRTEFVRPPKGINTTTTTTTSTTTETTTSTTTTTRALRTKRIWPKRMTHTHNLTLHNTTITKDNSTTKTDEYDLLASNTRVRVISRQKISTTPTPPPTKRSYRPVTRTPKIKYTTASSDLNFTHISANDWIPIVPSHYPTKNIRGVKQTPISRRSDGYYSNPIPSQEPVPGNQMMYLQSFRLLPVQPTQIAKTTPALARKNMVFLKKKHHQLYPHHSGYSTIKAHSPVPYVPAIDELELQTEASHPHPRVLTKIKHHHHHHHHKYVKTVEKKVPYKVEVPKPYLVPVEKKVNVPVEKIKYVDKPVPYPVTVEKRVPYPIGIKVPQPVPVKVVEKEYVPKPYPIVHHVPVVKHVQVRVPQPVPYAVEKRVPYPVEVKVPVHVDRPVPVPVQVEKRVPYPVPVRVLVPQPYAVETKVPYRVAVKEPVEVIKHVPIRVPVPQPFAVKVPHPVPVPYEKRVPYPVEVERKVPVPYEVIVPERVEVEKKVPVYIPKPYPVEKRVPYPVRVPFPVKVPVKVPVEVPVEVPIYIHSPLIYEGQAEYMTFENNASTAHSVTSSPDHNTVTVHGNGAFSHIQSRADSDTNSVSTTSSPQS